MEEELQQKIEQLEQRLAIFERHDHLIAGGEPLRLKDLPYYGLESITVIVQGTSAATDTNYDTFFTAEYDLEIVAASESHVVAANTATIQVDKLASGAIKTGGVNTLTAAFDLTTASETPVRLGATSIVANRTLKRGDRLALNNGGSLTNCRHVSVTVYYLPLYKISK